MDTSYTNANENNYVIQRNNSNVSVVDTMVDASKKSSSWVVDYCSMCTEYMDKQVQYEMMASKFQGAAEAAQAATATLRPKGSFDLQTAVGACHQNFDDIKATAKMMFDEESVVESVDLR
jgi:hypothetical protein